MGLFSDSSAYTSSYTDASTEVSNIGSSGVEGLAAASQTGNVTVNTLDSGAVGKSFDFASDSLRRQQQVIEQATRGAFDTSQSAIDTVGQGAYDALRLGAQTSANALDFADSALSSVAKAVGDALASVTQGSKEAQRNVLSAANQGIAAANPNVDVSKNTLLVAAAGFAAVILIIMVKK